MAAEKVIPGLYVRLPSIIRSVWRVDSRVGFSYKAQKTYAKDLSKSFILKQGPKVLVLSMLYFRIFAFSLQWQAIGQSTLLLFIRN